MHIVAGENQVTISTYGVHRHNNVRGLVLTITTTKDVISLADMDAVCDAIMANHHDIFVYDDNGEPVATLRGFYHNCLVTKDTTGNIKVEITNESENTYQIGILQHRSTNLENATALQGEVQRALENDLADQANLLLDQSETLAMQTETMGLLAEASEMQTMTLESLMLEVLPDLMATTVEEAVAAALAANSTTEPTDPGTTSEPEAPVAE